MAGIIMYDLEPMYDLGPEHELDNCVRCLGLYGGGKGNENRYPVEGGGYRVLCDYCSVAMDAGDDEDLMCKCGHTVASAHAVMRMEQIEAAWEQGIGVSICGEPGEPGEIVLVLLHKDVEPDDPCDEDFMKEISS